MNSSSCFNLHYIVAKGILQVIPIKAWHRWLECVWFWRLRPHCCLLLLALGAAADKRCQVEGLRLLPISATVGREI